MKRVFVLLFLLSACGPVEQDDPAFQTLPSCKPWARSYDGRFAMLDVCERDGLRCFVHYQAVWCERMVKP